MITAEGAEEARDRELDQELADVLVAISVITKRLAKKMNANLMKGAVRDEQDE